MSNSNEIPGLNRIVDGIQKNDPESRSQIMSELGVDRWEDVISMIQTNGQEVLAAVARSGVSEEATRMWNINEAKTNREEKTKEVLETLGQNIQKTLNGDIVVINYLSLTDRGSPSVYSCYNLREFSKTLDGLLSNVSEISPANILDLVNKVGEYLEGYSRLKTEMMTSSPQGDLMVQTYYHFINFGNKVMNLLSQSNLTPIISNFDSGRKTEKPLTNRIQELNTAINDASKEIERIHVKYEVVTKYFRSSRTEILRLGLFPSLGFKDLCDSVNQRYPVINVGNVEEVLRFINEQRAKFETGNGFSLEEVNRLKAVTAALVMIKGDFGVS